MVDTRDARRDIAKDPQAGDRFSWFGQEAEVLAVAKGCVLVQETKAHAIGWLGVIRQRTAGFSAQEWATFWHDGTHENLEE